jgi:ligand-binding sensor domain-containing protein
VQTFVQGENDAFWLGTNWGLVRRLSDGRMIHYLLDPKNDADVVRYLAEDKHGRVWMTRSDGLMVLKVDSASESGGAENFISRRAVVKAGIVNAEELPRAGIL